MRHTAGRKRLEMKKLNSHLVKTYSYVEAEKEPLVNFLDQLKSPKELDLAHK